MATRTTDERKTLNYFKLLKLDITVNDNAVIESTIQKRIQEWQRSNKTQFLKYKEDIRVVMLDPAERKIEADIYKAILDAEKAGIVGRIHVYLSMGAIDSIQFERLIKDVKQSNSRDYVLDLLKSENVAFIDFCKEFGIEKVEVVKEIIDAHMLLVSEKETIKDVVGEVDNFFAFMSFTTGQGTDKQNNTIISAHSSIADITKKMDDIYQECEDKDKAHKDNRYVTIENIRKAFTKNMKTEANIKFYSAYWRLFPLYEKVRYYDEKEYAAQLTWANGKGVGKQQTKLFLRYCYSSKDIPVLETTDREYVCCPVCENFYDKTKHKEKCPHCGSDSTWVCEVCGTRNSSSEVCGTCKIGKHEYSKYKIVVEQIRMLVASRRFDEANAKIVEAEGYRNIISYFDAKNPQKSEVHQYKQIISAEVGFANVKDAFTEFKFDKVTSLRIANDFINRFNISGVSPEIRSMVSQAQALVEDYKNAFRCTCGQIIKSQNIQVCPKCNKKLIDVCWNCGEKISTLVSDECPKCHATPAMQKVFTDEIARCTALVNAEKFDSSVVSSTVSGLRTKYKLQAVPGSVIFNQLPKIENEVKTFVSAYEQYVAKALDCVRKKEYYRAQELLNQLKRAVPNYDTTHIAAKIEPTLMQVSKLLKLANGGENKAIAVKYAEQCMELCLDCKDAEQIIRSFPPQKPISLAAILNGDNVSLQWEYIPDGRPTTFTVIRKKGSKPQSIHDGEKLIENLTVCNFTDKQIVPAIKYYYAVFATQKFSNDSIILHSDMQSNDNEIVALFNVSAITQIMDSSTGISLRWNMPENVNAVLVTRKEGTFAPKNLSDGISVKNIQKAGIDDSDVKEGIYSYYIVCRYVIDGKNYDSDGISYSAKKLSIPVAANVISISELSQCTYLIELDNEKNGTVKFYSSEIKHNFNVKSIEKITNFTKVCADLKAVTYNNLSNCKYQISIPSNSCLWIYPVVSNDTLFVVGTPFMVNNIVGLEGTDVIVSGNSIKIEGRISPKVRNVIAIVDKAKYYDVLYEGLQQRLYSREQFLNESGIQFSLTPGKYYITLFAEFIQEGNKTYSKPVRIPEVEIGEKTVVRYALNYQVSTTASYDAKVTFTIEENELSHFGNSETLPDIVIVQGTPRPMTKSDGVEVARISSVKLKKKMFKKGLFAQVVVKIPKADNAKNKLSLYFMDERIRNLQLKEI